MPEQKEKTAVKQSSKEYVIFLGLRADILGL